jgi:hypothetical protein
MRPIVIWPLYIAACAALAACGEAYYEGFDRVGEDVFISNLHRTEAKPRSNGVATKLINLKFINSRKTHAGSEIYEIEFYCDTGEFRGLGGAAYSEPGLKGSRKIVPPEGVSSLRKPQKDSAEEKVIAYARGSDAICGNAG